MFFIPWIAIGGGVSLVIWGAKKIFTNDDSADQRAKEILASMPTEFAKFVKSVDITSDGVRVHLKDSTPPKIEQAIRKNIKGRAGAA